MSATILDRLGLSSLRRGVIHLGGRRLPVVPASPMSLSVNCFCGASFNMQCPAMTDRQEQAAILEIMRGEWFSNHWHQLNPEMGALATGDAPSTDAIQPRKGLGFDVKK